ncbi:hypothetical protein ACFL4T_04430 [candidate division KSB1 bacterium]
MKRFFCYVVLFTFFINGFGDIYPNNNNDKVKYVLSKIQIVAYRTKHTPVEKTVVEEFKAFCAPGAEIKTYKDFRRFSGNNIFKIAVADENYKSDMRKKGIKLPDKKDWMYIILDESGTGEMIVSGQHLLYALYCRLIEDWMDNDISEFEKGKLITPTFKWLQGEDWFLGSRRRFTRSYDPEAAVREFARMGCSHINVNALASPSSLETGPAGEIYYRFYDSSPDLDQFTETELNKGTYPPEYLNSNLNFLKKQAELAVKYGLTPGMYICNPRSVPENLLEKYPYLRGARVDHPFRAYRPRYALTLGHPVVRWHYAQLLKNIQKEIPELGFISTWLNDSGSGFEHTMRLYAGRNGGPYIVREWNTNEEFAKAAAQNVIRYYKVLRDAGTEINPKFRIIAGLRAIPEEEDIIIRGMDNRIDLQVSIADTRDPEKWKTRKALLSRESYLHSGVSIRDNYIIGIPFPFLAYERLRSMMDAGLDRIQAYTSPVSLAPYDINSKILEAYNLDSNMDVKDVIKRQAVKWAGKDRADDLIKIWELSENAYLSFPDVPLYSHFGFEWYRLWVRPFVPDIAKIPEKQREYYEKYIMATFNNPHRVDLQADCLWNLIPVPRADEIVSQFDRDVWGPLDRAIDMAKRVVNNLKGDSPEKAVFIDIRDRLRGYKAYCRTLRNTAAWIAGVHGYLKTKNETLKEKRLAQVREMINNELVNTMYLKNLIETTTVNFIPIYDPGETWFQYGDNLPELLQKKIVLMEKYKDDLPYINPDYMWRLPEGFPVKPEEYLKY